MSAHLPYPLRQRSILLASGTTEIELRHMLDRGELTPIRRGTYLEGPPPDPVAVHRLRVTAAITELAPGAVASHVSAAVVHGLPIWGLQLDRLTVTRDRPSGGRVDPRLHTYTARCTAADILDVDGIPTTSAARTVVDLARTARFESAVVVADAALARHLVTPDDLAEALARAKGWPGVPRARAVVAAADGRAASVGETRSRVALLRAGLAPPVLQWEVRDPHGRLIGLVDFGWPQFATVGEFDGRVKYGRLLQPGQTPGDAVFAEKRREDALRALGLRVVRWTWDEIPSFTTKLRPLLH